ncbi:MAG: hypothetical protein PUF31_10835 [Oscillospiraceae bacterium]|nr:hypothetical protein [Oscillospiraceae bacterium]
MSKAKETHLWFEKGDDEIQIESYTKKLNDAILELNKSVPGAVYIIDDEESGFLRAAVKLKNITFMMLTPQSEEAKKAKFENGKRNSKNLKHQKRPDMKQIFFSVSY